MDINIIDHSDSDSGESWTILEPAPEYTEEVLQLSQNGNERFPTLFKEKDEDTDGISVISDSDHESPMQHKHMDDHYTTEDELPDKHDPIHVTDTPQITHFNENIDKTTRDEDYLMESNGKLKTYVHRRNKRLSTVLNVIMLGSVITAAGVAIGHMWGAKNDCTMHHTPSVNKILSNLYKLQEENSYLRSKLKELTVMNNVQMQHQKAPMKRCKKVFEEPLNSDNPNKHTKCIDEQPIEYEKVLDSHLIEPSFEKEFLGDLNKLKNIYKQNKSWLDEEIAKRIKHERQQLKNNKIQVKPEKIDIIEEENKTILAEDTKLLDYDNKKDNLMLVSETFSTDSIDDQMELIDRKKISYADSLKSEKKNKNVQKREVDKKWEYNEHVSKKRAKKTYEPNLQDVTSEEEIKKDDRYNCHKCKYNKRKTEKWRRKQKGRNKQELFDIKGLLKDYDDSQALPENQNNVDKIQPANDGTEKTKYENPDNSNTSNIKLKEKPNKNVEKEEKINWYEKRASLRKEYRNRLQQELFGEKSLNNSAWYFRRMKKREQCRAKAGNDTHKKTSKLNMNFKIKY
ncbi:PREDICTED: uncharacterized protein LOC106119474 [Papilio xuthus]|uniref:Uncharacterized protein LOC106119474 n=1 Tax=Papilio xuthus TaxID=66420 RepID=A0AAJ6ZD29_PAPXU|nr:PREDICTED: uncharacterized protein LOC106119474 [Papilio xuthus]